MSHYHGSSHDRLPQSSARYPLHYRPHSLHSRWHLLHPPNERVCVGVSACILSCRYVSIVAAVVRVVPAVAMPVSSDHPAVVVRVVTEGTTGCYGFPVPCGSWVETPAERKREDSSCSVCSGMSTCTLGTHHSRTHSGCCAACCNPIRSESQHIYILRKSVSMSVSVSMSMCVSVILRKRESECVSI